MIPRMKNKVIISLCIAVIGLSGCARKDAQSSDADESNMRNIKMGTLQLDSIPVDYFEASMDSYLCMERDTIFLFDKKFSWVMRFSKDGKLVDKVLHKGQGPKEINMDIQDYCFADSSLYILDSGLGITRYTSNYERKERLQIDCDRNREEVSYENPLRYSTSDLAPILKSAGNYFYRNAVAYQGMIEDFLSDTKKYFQNVHILLKINKKTGKMERVIGNYPPFYEQKHAAFMEVYYDIDPQNQFYVSFEMDSSIYCYDANFELLYTFGGQGKNMTAYDKSYSMETLLQERMNIRNKYSYYHHLKYLPELDMLFRSYTRPNDEKQDGLQIYQGKTLIADVSVPKKMYVLGYSAPYVYVTSGLDEMSESFALYRFEIK